MTSAISCIGHYVGALFHVMLMGGHYGGEGEPPEEEDHNAGSLTGFLFIILAIQTGLTELPPQKRLGKLYRNFWLLSMAMMHFVHHMVDRVLLKLRYCESVS